MLHGHNIRAQEMVPRTSSFLADAWETTLRDSLLDLECMVVTRNMNSYHVSLLKITSDCGGECPVSGTGCGATPGCLLMPTPDRLGCHGEEARLPGE